MRGRIRDEEDVVIPDHIGDYPVCGVTMCSRMMEDQERYNCIRSITFPDTMVNLNGMSCAYFRNLTSVTIPEGTECIGTGAFRGCSNLSDVTIPETVTYIPGDPGENADIEYHVPRWISAVMISNCQEHRMNMTGRQNISRLRLKI